MAYLLDNDVLIYHLRDVESANQLVHQLIDSGIAISAITYMEVVDRLQDSRYRQAEEQRFRAFVERVPIVEFGQDQAEIAA